MDVDNIIDKAEQMKKWIDNASYEELLRKWRFAPAGDPYFQGDIGQYYSKVMRDKRDLDPGDAVRASKHIGFEAR